MFGGQASSPFGTPASSASLFGSPSTGLFGASAASTGNFFGAQSPSAGTLFGAPPQSSSSMFGAQQSSASLFGSPAPSAGGLFGATSQSSLFGTAAPASGGLFGAPASSGGLFGAPASSGGLFGAPASSGGLFGAQPSSSSLFGAPASGGLFGSTGGLFASPQSASGFGASSSMFGASAPGQGLFGAQASPGMFGAVQAAPQPQQLQVEIGKDGRPITHETMFSNLPDHWQQAFKQVHGKVVEVRKDWRSLKSSVGVLESAGSEQQHAGLAAASKGLRADLATARKVLDLDSAAAEAFRANVLALADATQTAHDQLTVNVVRRDIENTRDEAQKQAKIMERAHLFKSMPPLPAPYLESAVEGFAIEVQRLSDMHADLAALVPAGGHRGCSGVQDTISTLPDVLRSLHEYFVHVAARVAHVRALAERMREAHLQTQAAQGNFFDPFSEADAEEELEAEARRREPRIQPVKPLAPGQASAGAAGGAAAPSTHVALSAPASSGSLLGGGFASGGFGGTGGRSTVKAKRR